MDFNFSFKCACGHASHPWKYSNTLSKLPTLQKAWTINKNTQFHNTPFSHCMKDCDLKYPYVLMLYWFQLNPLSSSKYIYKSNDAVELKFPH